VEGRAGREHTDPQLLTSWWIYAYTRGVSSAAISHQTGGARSRLEEPSATIAFKRKMATEEAKQIYARRSQVAEFPHAWIKQRCGLRQFRCRGRGKPTMEAIWACLSYNLTRWFSLRRKLSFELAPI